MIFFPNRYETLSTLFPHWYYLTILYSTKWRWIVVDIHWAAKRRGKYNPPLSPTLRTVNNCFSIYHTSWITSGPKSYIFCGNIAAKAILFFSGCLEVNSTWLITSEQANQCAQKVLFTCVVYTKTNCHCISLPAIVKTFFRNVAHLFLSASRLRTDPKPCC